MENQVFVAINQLMKINREHKRLLDAQMAEIGIHRTQHRILMHLARTGQLPSQKKLSEFLEITPAAVTGTLQKLEKDGYVERKLGSDNRFNEITVTERGKEVVEKTRALFSAVDNRLFDGFSDKEIGAFSAYLERIIVNLKGNKRDEKMV